MQTLKRLTLKPTGARKSPRRKYTATVAAELGHITPGGPGMKADADRQDLGACLPRWAV
jgi:hypothetical protein